MSYTSSQSTAILTLAGVNSASDAAQLYVDWLGKNKEKAPDCSSVDIEAEELLLEVLPYIAFENGEVIVKFDTESDTGCYRQYFDSITSYFRSIMSSELMKVNWSSYDSRDGSSSGTEYQDISGKIIDSDDFLADKKALDEIANLMTSDVWSPDTLNSIADIIRGTGRSVEEAD